MECLRDQNEILHRYVNKRSKPEYSAFIVNKLLDYILITERFNSVQYSLYCAAGLTRYLVFSNLHSDPLPPSYSHIVNKEIEYEKNYFPILNPGLLKYKESNRSN